MIFGLGCWIPHWELNYCFWKMPPRRNGRRSQQPVAYDQDTFFQKNSRAYQRQQIAQPRVAQHILEARASVLGGTAALPGQCLFTHGKNKNTGRLKLGGVHQCIYVIFSTLHPQLLYIGQTINFLFLRFKQHVDSANFVGRKFDNSPLYTYFRRFGLKTVYIYPLEIIRGTFDSKTFTTTASPREQFWIDHFKLAHFKLWNQQQPHPSSSVFRRITSMSPAVPPSPPLSQQLATTAATAPVAPTPSPPSQDLDPPSLAPPPSRDMSTISPPSSSRLFISRLFPNKIRDLFRRLQNNFFSENELDFFTSFRISTLRRTLNYLNNHSTSFLVVAMSLPAFCHNSHKRLSLILKAAIDFRAPPARNIDNPCSMIIFPGIYSVFSDHLNCSAVFEAAKLLLPAGIETKPLFTNRFSKPISSKFSNVQHIAKTPQHALNAILHSDCSCSSDFSTFCQPGCHHVVTNDPSILPTENLRRLAAMGAKYRHGLSEAVVTEELRIEARTVALQAFFNFAARCESDLEISGFDNWKNEITEHLDRQIDLDLPLEKILHPYGLSADHAPPPLTTTDLVALKRFQRSFIITVVDKMANSFCFICKKHYLRLIQADLQTSTIFEQSASSRTELFSSLSTKMSAMNIPPGSLSFPNYTLLIKLHKTPAAPRFIVAARNVVTTPAAVLLCKILKALDPFLVSLMKVEFDKIPGFSWHGSSPVLKNTADMVKMMENANRFLDNQVVSFQSADVARLYTNIPLDSLKATLKTLYNKLFDALGEGLKVFLQRKKTCAGVWLGSAGFPPPDAREGGTNSLTRYRIFTFNDVSALIDFVVDNNYVSFGGNLYRQILGIAMGGNASVYLANHYLFSYELAFFKQLIDCVVSSPPSSPPAPPIESLPLYEPPNFSVLINHHDIAICLLKAFLHLTRYIDDISSLNNPYFSNLLYTDQSFYNFHGLYPRQLELTLTSPSPSLNYLDITISSMNSDNKTPLHSSFYNKFSEPAFRSLSIIRFTHASSNISKHIKRNLLTGVFHRYRSNLTNPRSFIHSMAVTFVNLQRSGYSSYELRSFLTRLCRNYPGSYNIQHQALSRRILLRAKRLMENSS